MGARPRRQRRSFSLRRLALLLFGLGLGLAAHGSPQAPPDPPASPSSVRVPGGVAAVRRLLGLGESRDPAGFFLELHTALLAEAEPHAPWERIPRRKLVRDFERDLAEWRRDRGESAQLSAAAGDARKRLDRALEWLGFDMRFSRGTLTVEPKDDAVSLRRQSFLDAFGLPVPALLRRLQAGETVTVATADGEAPLPFGLAAWQETLNDPLLSRESAFTRLVENVAASRLLVALHALDAPTRERLRGAVRDEAGRPAGWRVLYERCLDGFTRFPEAIAIEGGAFVLPGGAEASAVFAEAFELPSPREHAAFLEALYARNDAKAAYVADVLQQLPEASVRALLLGGGGRERRAGRARTLFRAIERASGNFARDRRDPYDFAHVARFLRFGEDGELVLPGGPAAWQAAMAGSDFPEEEGRLQALLAAGVTPLPADELLAELLRREGGAGGRRSPAQRRFLLVSSLLEARPALTDPGLVVLLYRGVDRLLTVYGTLLDLPLRDTTVVTKAPIGAGDAASAAGTKAPTGAADAAPAAAPAATDSVRRLLFRLDRLERESGTRPGEVAAGTFQSALELLAALEAAGSLGDGGAALVERLVESPSPAEWTLTALLPALRERERAAAAERRRREEEYRTALEGRNARLEVRHERALALREEARRGAEQRLREFLEPGCPADDRQYGPWPPRLIEDRAWLAGTAVSSPELSAEGLAQVWINDAIALEHTRTRPLAEVPPLARVPGALPGTEAVVDPSEPMPAYTPAPAVVESRTADELLTRAMIGRLEPVAFEWRGTRYRFDGAEDERRRRTAFRERQRLATLGAVEEAHRHLAALRAARDKGDGDAAREALAAVARSLALPEEGAATEEPAEVRRAAAVAAGAAAAVAELARQPAIQPAALDGAVEALDAAFAARHLEALLGHVYAAVAGDPEDLFFQEPELVRRHSFRREEETGGRVLRSAFSETALTRSEPGQGSRITGSVFGVAEVLALLHAEQLSYRADAPPPTDDVKTGILAAARRIRPARIHADALAFVAAASRGTEELAASMARLEPLERLTRWQSLAGDLVPRRRLGALSEDPAAVSTVLSPSELFRIGRRVALGEPAPSGTPSIGAARAAWERLVERFGAAGAHERLAVFGPRAAAWSGRARLEDIDLPPYERLASYRFPQLFCDRLYDLKVAVARRMAEAGVPAGALPLILPPALDEQLSGLRMAYAYDWGAVVASSQAFSAADLDRLLDAAREAGRLVREDALDVVREIP